MKDVVFGMKKDKMIISSIRTRIKTLVIIGILLGVAFTINAEPETITFESRTLKNKPLTLTGVLVKPEGEGPFPAIILLHGCGGIYSKSGRNLYNPWVSRLNSWGYVTIQVDSLGPRNQTNTCDNPFKVHAVERMHDAYAAKSYLENQSYVDDNNLKNLPKGLSRI